MALFAPTVPAPTPQPISKWVPGAGDAGQSSVGAIGFAPAELAAWHAGPVAAFSAPTDTLGFGSTGYTTPHPKTVVFPSLMKIFNRPRNMFGG